MASIHTETALEISADAAWQALKDVRHADRLFAPVLVGAELAGDVRTVRFANGLIVRERILDVDDRHRRVAYSAQDVPGMTYHHASMQIVETGPRSCRFEWTSDFLPAEHAASIAPVIDAGTEALKRNLEEKTARESPGTA